MYRTPVNTLYSCVDAVGTVLQRLQECISASQVNMKGVIFFSAQTIFRPLG